MKQFLTCLLATVSIASSASSLAEARGLVWHGPGPEGIGLYGLAVIPGNTPILFASTPNYSPQAFRSPDGGRHWSTPAGMEEFAADGFAVSPSLPAEIFTIGYPVIHRSFDAGDTWTAIASPAIGETQSMAIDPFNPAIVYAGTVPVALPGLPNNGGGLFRSTDAGDTWNEMSITTPVPSLAIDPTDSNVIFAVSQGLVLRSSDGGNHWTTLAGPLAYAYQVLTDATLPGRVFVISSSGLAISLDHGVTWSLAGGVFGTKSTETRPSAVTGVPGFPGVLIAGLYTGSSGHCYRSTDGGATWELSERGLAGQAVFNHLAVNTGGGEVFAATYAAGVYESTDGGESWETRNSGLPGADGEALAVAPSRANTAYVGTFAGVFRTDDGGATWQSANSGLGLSVADALAVDPHIETTAYAETGSGIFKTVDRGTTWTETGPAPVAYEVAGNKSTALAISPVDSRTIFASGPTCESSLIVSRDGGSSWNPVPFSADPDTCPAIQTIAFNPRSPATIFIGSTQGIFQSTDEGKSWILRNNFDDLSWTGGFEVSGFAFDPFDPNVVVTIVEGGLVYRSDDGAASWNNLFVGNYFEDPATAMLVDPAVRGRLLVGVGVRASNRDGIWESLDGGSSWHPFVPGTTGFFVSAMALSADRTRLYATGSGTMSLLPPKVPGIAPPPARRLGGR